MNLKIKIKIVHFQFHEAEHPKANNSNPIPEHKKTEVNSMIKF